MSFGNPLGLLALLGFGAVLLIHLLRVRARKLRASTLFLLETRTAANRGGRRFERLRSEPLLWVQLLVVALVTWLLVEPQWLREDSTLRVVVVVDGSASMTAFRNPLERSLVSSLSSLERAASTTEWILLSSDPRERRLYSGTSRDEVVRAAMNYRGRLSAHEPGTVLATARSIAGSSGAVLFVTDHREPVPAGVELVAVGSPTPNVGFAGLEVAEDGTFRALVKSSSDRPETRRLWRERTGERREEGETISLAPFEIRTVAGRVPDGEDELTLVLEPDAFPLDDRLPLVRPEPKGLRLYVAPELEDDRFVERFLETLSPFERMARADEADLALTRSALVAPPCIVFPSVPKGRGLRTGPVVTAKDELTDGLGFGGLLVPLVQKTPGPRLEESDRVLVWQGEEPLVFLRESRDGGATHLVVGFGLDGSNADRVPAFILLLHRFAESVRASVPSFERKNVELHQQLLVASDSEVSMEGGGEITGDEITGGVLRAPDEPGFFVVGQDSGPLLEAAAHFADVREADLTKAGSRELDPAWQRGALERNSLPDPLRGVWGLVLLGLSTLAWSLQEKRRS